MNLGRREVDVLRTGSAGENRRSGEYDRGAQLTPPASSTGPVTITAG